MLLALLHFMPHAHHGHQSICSWLPSLHSINLKFFYFLKTFIAKTLNFGRWSLPFSKKWKPTLNPLNFHSSTSKYRANMYLHVSFPSPPKEEIPRLVTRLSTWACFTHYCLVPPVLSSLNPKNKTLAKLAFLTSHCIFLAFLDFCLYNSPEVTLWMLSVKSYKNPFIFSSSSSYYVYLWY